MSLFILVFSIPLVKSLTDIQFLELSTKPLPTHCWAGIAATYNNTLYAIHGGTCGQEKGNCDLPGRLPLTYTLDLSDITLTGTYNKIITFTNNANWAPNNVNNIANSTFTSTTGGYQSSGYTFIDNYAWALYPSENIFDGTRSMMRYDMSTNSYTSKPGNPYDSYIERDTLTYLVYINTCNAKHGNYLYTIGGMYQQANQNNATNDIWRLELSTETWTQMAPMPTARHRLSCAVLGGSIYTFGGQVYHPSKAIVNIIEQYVIANDLWYPATLHNSYMSVGRQQHVSHTHPNNKWIITLGGRATDGNNVNVPIEIFEPLNRVYTTDIMYWQRFFYSTIYEFNSDISIIFAYGGYLNKTYYKQVKYMVLHKNDHIPSWTPTKHPTVDPTYNPTVDPTVDPTFIPTIYPTYYPTYNPTYNPTNNPSITPTKNPTPSPTENPTPAPTINPTYVPTNNPSINPTFIPTFIPTINPTQQPTFIPTNNPSITPTKYPTVGPTIKPTRNPLEPNKTHSPTNNPTNTPTNNPTHTPTTGEPSSTPSKMPTNNPNNSPISILYPTQSPHREGGISDISTTLQIMTTGESFEGKLNVLDTNAVENLNNSVNYFIIALIGFCTFFMLISFFANRLVYTGCDPPNYFALLWVIMELYDFASDVSFSVYLWYLKDSEGNELLTIFIFTSIFIYLPYFMNLIYLSHRIRRWKTKLRRSAIGEWLAYWDWWLICLSMLSGGSHPAVEICNSLLFPMDAFGMHLPWTEIVRIRTERFCTTVLFENVPQLCIQLYLLATLEAVTGNSIIYLTILSSVGSIAFSGLYYFVNQHKVKVSQNHWIFRMRLTSSEIEEYHKHSYYKLQVAISKSLEIPNVEWVRITSVQPKADELRCDGFISIPDQYLQNKKKKRKQSDNPEKQKEINDMRRASAMYRNTFDENERNEFMHRLEAVKEEESHYHKTLTKQLKYDIKLNHLKLYFEIGGGNREGVGNNNNNVADIDYKEEYNGYNNNNNNNKLQPIPIIHFAPEGDQINATGSMEEGPGNNNNNGQIFHNDIEYKSIEMAMVNHQVNNELQGKQSDILEDAIMAMSDNEINDDVTPGNSISTINTIDNSPFNMSYNDVDKVLIDDEVDNILNIEHNENKNNNNQPGSPEHHPMRTDDGMIEQMVNEEFKLNHKTKKKSHAQIVDEQVMNEIAKITENEFETNTNDFDGEIIDADLNGGIDVDAIIDNNVEMDLVDDGFEIETIQ